MICIHICGFSVFRTSLLWKISYACVKFSKLNDTGLNRKGSFDPDIIYNKESILGENKPSIDGKWTMEPYVNEVLSITVPMNKPFDEIPSSISLSLDTQYSLMRKTDTVSLQFAFVWWMQTIMSYNSKHNSRHESPSLRNYWGTALIGAILPSSTIASWLGTYDFQRKRRQDPALALVFFLWDPFPFSAFDF